MTLGAKRTKRAEPECIEVAVMRLDMICDSRRRDAAGLEAQAAQGFDAQLVRPAALPGCGAVPTMNFRTMRHYSLWEFWRLSFPLRLQSELDHATAASVALTINLLMGHTNERLTVSGSENH
jgi:hypothetical protein